MALNPIFSAKDKVFGMFLSRFKTNALVAFFQG